MLQGCECATRLVEQSFTLSRLQAQEALALQSVALDEVAREVLADLAPAALDLGERFFRVLDSGASGSGLGWAGLVIVRRIAAAHGARVEVACSEHLGGLSVRVEWPAAAQAVDVAF